MQIKISQKAVKGITGIPHAKAGVTHGVTTMGAGQVTLVLSALDVHAIPSMVATLRMSVSEASELATLIQRESDRADLAARAESKGPDYYHAFMAFTPGDDAMCRVCTEPRDHFAHKGGK